MAAAVLSALALALAAATAQPWPCDPAKQAQAEADAALAKRAYAASPADRQALLPTLAQAMDHAPPAPVPERTVCGDTVVAYANNALLALLEAGAKAPEPGSPRQTVVKALPYLDIAFLLGSILDEQGRYGEAVTALQRGDALQPGGALIASELAFALVQTHRSAEAVPVISAALDANPTLAAAETARLHRTRGYALGELGRYDDAIADYRASQKLDPSERLSANEITYLQGRKGGAGASQVVVITSDKVSEPLPRPPASKP